MVYRIDLLLYQVKSEDQKSRKRKKKIFLKYFIIPPKSLTIYILVNFDCYSSTENLEVAIQLNPIYAYTALWHTNSDSCVLEKIQDVKYNTFSCLTLVDCPV